MVTSFQQKIHVCVPIYTLLALSFSFFLLCSKHHGHMILGSVCYISRIYLLLLRDMSCILNIFLTGINLVKTFKHKDCDIYVPIFLIYMNIHSTFTLCY